jgi:hypothetical protein
MLTFIKCIFCIYCSDPVDFIFHSVFNDVSWLLICICWTIPASTWRGSRRLHDQQVSPVWVHKGEIPDGVNEMCGKASSCPGTRFQAWGSRSACLPEVPWIVGCQLQQQESVDFVIQDILWDGVLGQVDAHLSASPWTDPQLQRGVRSSYRALNPSVAGHWHVH